MKFLPVWERRINDDIRFPALSRKWTKYTPFIMFDRTKFREIALKELK
jgi:predicted nucleotidyltransferase